MADTYAEFKQAAAQLAQRLRDSPATLWAFRRRITAAARASEPVAAKPRARRTQATGTNRKR